jgi:hypothetical protein
LHGHLLPVAPHFLSQHCQSAAAQELPSTVTNVTSSFDEMLPEKSPTDLKIINQKTLLGLGAGAKETERFLNNSAFSPSQQTAFVLNLRSLNGVANRGAFVRTAGETSSDESDAIFCVQTAALMSKIHKDETLARWQ